MGMDRKAQDEEWAKGVLSAASGLAETSGLAWGDVLDPRGAQDLLDRLLDLEDAEGGLPEGAAELCAEIMKRSGATEGVWALLGEDGGVVGAAEARLVDDDSSPTGLSWYYTEYVAGDGGGLEELDGGCLWGYPTAFGMLAEEAGAGKPCGPAPLSTDPGWLDRRTAADVARALEARAPRGDELTRAVLRRSSLGGGVVAISWRTPPSALAGQALATVYRPGPGEPAEPASGFSGPEAGVWALLGRDGSVAGAAEARLVDEPLAPLGRCWYFTEYTWSGDGPWRREAGGCSLCEGTAFSALAEFASVGRPSGPQPLPLGPGGLRGQSLDGVERALGPEGAPGQGRGLQEGFERSLAATRTAPGAGAARGRAV